MSGAVKRIADFQGIPIHIDRPIGTTQTGTDEAGNEWSRTYQVDYGFIPSTAGGDGEELDVFLGNDASASTARWVTQQKADGSFDEFKLMLGFSAADEARLAYAAHVPKERMRRMDHYSVEHVKALLGVHPTMKALAAALGRQDKDMTNGQAATDARGATVSRPAGLHVCAAELSAVREAEREVDFICSTDARDSYGEVVKQNWRLDRFVGNPVALWSHDSHSLPVGQWLNVRVEKGALRGTFKCASEKANPLAENVWHSIKEGTLRAVSVGFKPGSVKWEEVNEIDTCVLDDNELFEISIVPLPACPDALIDEMKARAKAAYLATKTPALSASGAGLTTKTTGHEPRTKEAPVAAEKTPEQKKKDDDEMAAEAQEKATAALRTRAVAAETERDALTAKAAEAAAERTKLAADLDLANKRAADLSAKLTEAQILPLIGVKIMPAEKDGLIEIAKHFASQGEAGEAKLKAHLDAIAARPDLKLLGGTVLGADPTGSGLRTAGADAGSELAALVNATATT